MASDSLQGTSVLAEQTEPIEVLAANEWPGLNQAPELLAAFVRLPSGAMKSRKDLVDVAQRLVPILIAVDEPAVEARDAMK